MTHATEVTALYGKVFLSEILNYVDSAALSVENAEVLAFRLGKTVGGNFKKKTRQSSLFKV